MSDLSPSQSVLLPPGRSPLAPARPRVPRSNSEIEAALERSEAFYHSLVEGVPYNVFGKDLDGRFTFGNSRFCAELGVPLEQIIGRTDDDFFPSALASKYRADDLRVMEEGRALETIEEHVTPSGEKLYVQVIKTPVYSASGRVIGTQGMFRDITPRIRREQELKAANAELAAKEEALLKTMTALKQSHEDLIQAQMQLIQAEKMESVGRLAAGVAHEVKNPLATLVLGLDYLRRCRPAEPGDDVRETVMKAMRDAITRADAIVRGLVDFSAHRQLDLRPQDLNDVIRQSLFLVKHELSHAHVSVVEQVSPEPLVVGLDAIKIQQVFINLFMNACHAMEQGGTLTVRTRAAELPDVAHDEGSRVAERFRTGDRVVIAEIDDTGCGVPEDHLAKVWDPFFTTKSTGKGTGLGLTVTRKIVELHSGAIVIKNRPEGGARVTITLKALQRPAP